MRAQPRIAGEASSLSRSRHDPGVGAVGAAMQEHPALLRDTPLAGLSTEVTSTAAAWSMMALAFISRG